MKTVLCDKCNKDFCPNEEETKLIIESEKKGMTFIVLNCPNCFKAISYNPKIKKTNNSVIKSKNYRCPISGCAGWVSFVNEPSEPKSFWGCGECGSIWYEKKTLFKEIEEIQKKYSYRKKCYLKSKNEWQPSLLKFQSDNYELLVEQEPKEKRTGFERK